MFPSAMEIKHTNQNKIIFLCSDYPKTILSHILNENKLVGPVYHYSYLIQL